MDLTTITARARTTTVLTTMAITTVINFSSRQKIDLESSSDVALFLRFLKGWMAGMMQLAARNGRF